MQHMKQQHPYLATRGTALMEIDEFFVCRRHGIIKDYFGKVRAGDEELDELLNDPEILAAVLDKKPPAPRKSKR